jgi:hypothetical protein
VGKGTRSVAHMTRITTWLADSLSAWLDADAREAVRGDAEELGRAGPRLVWDLLSVILRRDARVWTHAGPWLALLLVIVPSGFVLSVVSRAWALSMAIYGWLYIQNWTWGYLGSVGARRDTLEVIGTACLQGTSLVLWSWTIGFVIGSLSRRAAPVNGLFLAVMVCAATTGTTTIGVLNPGNATVFSLFFYRAMVPLCARILLVILPACLGIHRACRPDALSRWSIAWSLAAAIVTGIMVRPLMGALAYGLVPTSVRTVHQGVPWSRFGGWSSAVLPLVPFVMAWPIAYLMIQVYRQHRQSLSTPA